MADAGVAEDRPKGESFVKVYGRGLERIRFLLDFKGGPAVGKLWLFLVEHCGHDNALVASAEVLADALGVSERTVRRAAKALEDGKALVIGKVGNANVYILNDGEVWKTYEDHKRFCGFRAKTLVGFKENPGFRARVSHMLPAGAEGREAPRE